MPLKGLKWILTVNVFLSKPQGIYHVFVCHEESVKLDVLTLLLFGFAGKRWTLNILVTADRRRWVKVRSATYSVLGEYLIVELQRGGPYLCSWSRGEEGRLHQRSCLMLLSSLSSRWIMHSSRPCSGGTDTEETRRECYSKHLRIFKS